MIYQKLQVAGHGTLSSSRPMACRWCPSNGSLAKWYAACSIQINEGVELGVRIVNKLAAPVEV